LFRLNALDQKHAPLASPTESPRTATASQTYNTATGNYDS